MKYYNIGDCKNFLSGFAYTLLQEYRLNKIQMEPKLLSQILNNLYPNDNHSGYIKKLLNEKKKRRKYLKLKNKYNLPDGLCNTIPNIERQYSLRKERSYLNRRAMKKLQKLVFKSKLTPYGA